MNKNKDSFMFYPEIIDKDFNEKIYLKKEFRDTEIKEKINWNNFIEHKKEFTLQPHQIFLKNYISPDTPYNGLLVFHGTGVGKTCTAIQIGEGFKRTLKNMNKKILILTNLKKNFFKELFNFKEEKKKTSPDYNVQCTGKAYQLGEESLYLTQEQKKKEIEKLIRSYYQFFPYAKFANYITENTGGWKGGDKDINEKVKNFISKEFDDRVIIIDEIQNIKTDKKEDFSRNIQLILESIIKYGKNIKLILMSATPMFDRPDEIIYYINLLLQNDGREMIKKNEIFTKEGSLKNGAEQILKEVFTGYVSYMRGEQPFIFPFRIYPKNAVVPKIEYYISGEKIDKKKKIKFTKIILCDMKKIQSNTYKYFLEKKFKNEKFKKNINNSEENENLDDISNDNNDNNENNEDNENKKSGILSDLVAISNIVYPIANNNDIGSFNSYSIDNDFDNGLGGYYKSIKIVGSKKKIQYKYQEHAIFNKDTNNETPFADEKYLSNYSTKFSSVLETIKNSKGLILIFSQYIDQGVLPLSLILEQNGFYRDCSDGEEQLLDYNANKLKKGGKRRPICYLCGKDANYFEHYDEKCKNYHIFKIAKYILSFGGNKDIIKISKDEALKKFNSDKNRNGEEIKIFIGTRVISEGLDFKRLRQVHIIEPWYNLSRHEQIIGRAIRFQSHRDLPIQERNVEIYQYASILEKSKNKIFERESIDLKYYRMAENKDIIIKNISRIMKESAIDCVLFKNANIIDNNKKIKQITSSGQILDIPIADKPFTSVCDYKENCNYKCNWMPNPRLKYPINTDTYNIRFSSNDIEKIKKQIKNMFRENIVFYLGSIEDKILAQNKYVDKLFIYTALEELVNNKNEIVYDKFSRKGYIIYRGDYYIFQPFDLERDEIPILYRENPTTTKPDYIDLENIIVDYNKEEIKENKENIINENDLVENIIKNINSIKQSHIEIAISDKKKYLLAVIGLVIDKLSKKNGILFIKNILTQYIQKSTNENIENIIEYLNINNNLINFYSDIVYEKSKIKNNIFVGFIFDDEYYILDSIDKTKDIKTLKINKLNFVNCSKETLMQIKYHQNIYKKKNKEQKPYNIIYGIIEYNKKKFNKIFKIVDKSVEESILTKQKKTSKRSIITGRTCGTFQYEKLIEIREKLKMYKFLGKKKIDFICEDLELYFRYNKLLNTNNKIWFEEIK